MDMSTSPELLPSYSGPYVRTLASGSVAIVAEDGTVVDIIPADDYYGDEPKETNR